MADRFRDIAIVGGGILGAALAHVFLDRGRRVVLCERYTRPAGGSVRNFGLVWPFIVPADPSWVDRGRRTREQYMRMAGRFAGGYERRGAVLAASTPAEAAVCEEFASRRGDLAIECELLDARTAARRQPLLRESAICAALWFADAGAVDPRRLVGAWLLGMAEQSGLDYRAATTVVRVESDGEGVVLLSADGERIPARRALVAGGDELRTLYPRELAAAGLRRCNLEMLQTEPGQAHGAGIALGRSLRQYALFASCPSFGDLTREASRDAATAELDAHGIHLLVKPCCDGSLILGDSHVDQAGDEPPDFDHEAPVERLLLDLAERHLAMPRPTIARRWLGYYARHPEQPFVSLEPQPRVHLVGGLTCGMSAAFGWAEDFVTALPEVAR